LSEATVEWSGAKGGVPFGHKPILLYLTTVKAALRILGSQYDALAANGETEAMCRKLAHHVIEMNAQRVRHDIDLAPKNVADMPGEFSKVGPNQASSTMGFQIIFHPGGRVDYMDGGGVTRIDTELYVRPLRVAIYSESRSLKSLDGSRANEILANIVRALTFLGHPTEIV
jgi:hypothetical protein